MSLEEKNIYIVASCNHTLAGRLIRERAKLKFWNRYPGDEYSHISLSLDEKLDNMRSFARKKPNNPLISGLVAENIRAGVFSFWPEKSKIAVFKIPCSAEQYAGIQKTMDEAWKNRNSLKYNFLGLFLMLLIGRGATVKNHYFCSQWAAEVLKENGLEFFESVKPCHIRPFDMYSALRKFLAFEGCLMEYPFYNLTKGDKVLCRDRLHIRYSTRS